MTSIENRPTQKKNVFEESFELLKKAGAQSRLPVSCTPDKRKAMLGVATRLRHEGHAIQISENLGHNESSGELYFIHYLSCVMCERKYGKR